MVKCNEDGTVTICYDGWTFTLSRNGGIVALNVRGAQKSAATILRRFGEEPFRELFRSALLALDQPYKWKGAAVVVPPHMRSTPRGNS